MITREVLTDGSVRLSGGSCTFHFKSTRPGLLLVTATGSDTGALGDRALEEINAEIRRFGPLELFIDASEADVATVVRETWTDWFQANRKGLTSVHVLVASKFMNMVVSVARLFSRTDELIRIHTDRDDFSRRLARSAATAN